MTDIGQPTDVFEPDRGVKMNAEQLKRFFHRTREWSRATRGLELLEMASQALSDLVEVDSGFFIYKRRGIQPGITREQPTVYVPWGVFAEDKEALETFLMPFAERKLTLVSPAERWILAEDISSVPLRDYFSKYPLLEFGVWPIISREELTGAVVVSRTKAVSDRMTMEMSHALVDSCAAQISVALDLIHTVRIAEAASERDLLTGVYNRRGIDSRLVELVESTQHANEHLIFGILDFDDFKAINDMYGHPAGDAALQEVAKIIENCVRPDDIVGRLGGDEFVIAFRSRHPDWVPAMKRIQEAIRISSDGYAVSVGAAVWGVDGDTLDICYEIADQRLYADKRTRKYASSSNSVS